MRLRKLLLAVNKYVISSDFRFEMNARMGWYDNMPDDKYLKRRFKASIGATLNLENPQTFNEKLQWLKLYSRKPEYTMMVDKYAVKKYVADMIGEQYIIPTLGVWNNFDDINFNKLPNQFVLKCTHDSGGLIIVPDKSKLDKRSAKKKIEKCLKRNYFYSGREWPYKNVPRKIICEKYMVDSANLEDGINDCELMCFNGQVRCSSGTKDGFNGEGLKVTRIKDYKFYCFNGEVKAVMINSDRNSNEPTKADYFDKEYNWLDFTWGYTHAAEKPAKPVNFEKMVQIAEKLSAGMPHVRIDLYNCSGKIYFGEITFFDGSGFEKIKPIEWDYKLGGYLTLPLKIIR